MNFDGTYTEPPPDDPITGVVMTHFETDPLEQTATVEFTYFRKSNSIAHKELITVKADEWISFATKLWPTMDFGKACIAALSYRLPNVTKAGPISASGVQP